MKVNPWAGDPGLVKPSLTLIDRPYLIIYKYIYIYIRIVMMNPNDMMCIYIYIYENDLYTIMTH